MSNLFIPAIHAQTMHLIRLVGPGDRLWYHPDSSRRWRLLLQVQPYGLQPGAYVVLESTADGIHVLPAMVKKT